jgi:hypothetical protein
MSTDLQNDYKQVKSKISAYQTTVENKKSQDLQKRESSGDNFSPKKSSVSKTLDDFTEKTNKSQKEVKNQLDELIDIFSLTTPRSTSSDTVNILLKYFTEAAIATKGKLKDIIITETVSTLGCAQEQEFEPTSLYVRVQSVDIFKKLVEDPADPIANFLYEKEPVDINTLPFSMNRELYNRLQNIGFSYNQEFNQNYIGASGQELFNIEYVTQDGNGTPGDFFKVTLNSRLNNVNRVGDFLVDYYSSINILDFEVLYANIMNLLTGMVDFSLNIPKDQLEVNGYLQKILQRMMGLCFDERKEIDVAGTSKLSDLDFIDDTFYELSPQDLRSLNDEIDNIVKGITEFEDCGNVRFPVNVESTSLMIQKVRNAKNDTEASTLVQSSLDELSKDPNWLLTYPSGLQINLAVKFDYLRQLPRAMVGSIISPKVLLGLMVMIKALKSEIADLVEDAKTFLLAFKNYIIQIMSKITAIFVEELFKLIKKNIKLLVESLVFEIATEAKDKRLKMIASITFVLYQLASIAIDFRRCKSVVDELLKLLSLALKNVGLGIPNFVLFGAQFLNGISDTRAFANVIENLQKSGLPTGDLPDGSPNQINQAFFNMIKGQNAEQAENGKTEIFIPPLTVITAAGPGYSKPVKASGKSY